MVTMEMDMKNGSSQHGMMMYFHTEIGGDYILFKSWKPQDGKGMHRFNNPKKFFTNLKKNFTFFSTQTTKHQRNGMGMFGHRIIYDFL